MEKYIILGHSNPDVDSIVSGMLYESYLKKLGKNVSFVIPDTKIEEDTLRILAMFQVDPQIYQKKLTYDGNTKFILLDHHQREGIGEVVQIIDHHPTKEPISVLDYMNEPVGSTAYLIVHGKEDSFSKKEITLALLATFIDTVSFHNSKTREEDYAWAQAMCQRYQLDFQQFYQLGLCLTDLSDFEKACFNGHKKYQFGTHVVESSYIQIKDTDRAESMVQDMLDLLGEYVVRQKLDMYAFIVYDMDVFKSRVYKVTDDGFTSKQYDELASRGMTIIPEIETEFATYQFTK